MRYSKIPHWIPDWKHDASYPANSNEWSTGKWIWEFLRRNPDYRADYERFMALPDFYLHGRKTSKWSGRSACQDDDMQLRYCDPPALPGERFDQYCKRMKASSPDSQLICEMPLEDHLREKWGVVHLNDPDECDFIIGGIAETRPYWIQIHAPDAASGVVLAPPDPDGYEHITLRFDLRFGIDKQIEDAKAFLMERRETLDVEKVQSSGKLPSGLPKYLRAFDANLVGAKPSIFGLKLYPDKTSKSAGDALKTAVSRAVKKGKKLVNGDYKNLFKYL